MLQHNSPKLEPTSVMPLTEVGTTGKQSGFPIPIVHENLTPAELAIVNALIMFARRGRELRLMSESQKS